MGRTLAELGACDHNISLILTCCCIQCRILLSSRTLSLKLHAAANVEVIASCCMCMGVMNDSSTDSN